MKRYFLLSSLIMFLSAIFFVACKKGFDSQNEVTQTQEKNEISLIRQSSKVCDYLTIEDIQGIGEAHNEFVIDAYKNIDFENSETWHEDVVNQFYNFNLDYTPFTISKDSIFSILMANHELLATFDFDLRSWSNHPFSEEVYRYLTTIYDEIDNLNSLEEFYVSMDNLQNYASSSLNCEDYYVLTGVISIAKSSAYLWAPTEIGGYDLYSKTFGNSSLQRRGWSWKKALVADVAESATYFTGFGVALAVGWATPGANVAILGLWALSAGMSSGLGGLL